MFGKIFTKIRPFIGSLIAAVVLLLAIVWGVSNGQKLAQAEIISQTAKNTTAALGYFYQDQNRYPSLLEFSDQNTMLNYLSSFPLPELPSKNCVDSFDYKKNSSNAYSLSFCIPVDSGANKAGWNTISGPTDSIAR